MDIGPHSGVAQTERAGSSGSASARALPESLCADIRQLEELEHSLRPLLQQTAEELRQLAGLAEAKPGAAPAAIAAGTVEPLLEGLRQNLCALELRVKQLDERCEAIARLSAVNCARIEEILHSRTWRILTGLGGLFLRLRRS